MFWFWLYMFLFFIFDVYTILWGIEIFIASFQKVAPQVPSNFKMRQAVVDEIRKYYPNTKRVLDIGCCYGGMANMIGKNFKNMSVTGVEKMVTPYSYAKIVNAIFGPKNVKFVFGDAFKFIESSAKFDIGVAYLFPSMMKKVKQVAKKFDVLIILDFPLPDVKPKRIIKLNKNHLGQHYMYVYEK